MRKLLYVTGSRAEYGIMKRLLKMLDNDSNIDLEIVVTGMHLLKEYGETYKEVEKDFKIKKIDIDIANRDNYDILHSMSIAMEKFAQLFKENTYNALMLLGDRYEILPVAIAAAINGIPIIHIHGGEKTLGNYDEFIRHSITKMSNLHLVATEEYRNRVIQLGETPDTVKKLGSLGVSNVLELKLLKKSELEKNLNILLKKDYYVILFHPETITGVSLEKQTKNLIEALEKFKSSYDFIFIGSNSDTGSANIQNILNRFIEENNFYSFKSLTTIQYLSLLKHSKGLIGNSSSGIIEVPSLKISTINIGDRQLGRVKGSTIIDTIGETKDIISAIKKSQSKEYMDTLEKSINPYFQKNSLENYYEEIKKFLQNEKIELKDFFDLNNEKYN